MRLLKIHSLPNSKIWVDRDIIMLHACFQLLEDYIEKEDGLNHACAETYKALNAELSELNNWWRERKKTITNPSTKSFESQKDDEMLARLIKHRTFLWT